jgi:branched-chain amino acid aminotransferase
MIDNCPAWRNGKWCEVKDLSVSVLDFGLIHCDATYDVISVKGEGNTRLIDMHIDRFIKSCDGWRIPLMYSKYEIREIITELHNRISSDCLIWICTTRGTPNSGNPRDLMSCAPNLMMYAKPYYGFNEKNEATVCLAKSVIRTPDEAINQVYKNFAWNDLTKAQWEATDRGFDTALLLSSSGYLTEGPGFNVCLVWKDCILTPKTNRLSGITVQLIQDICRANEITFLQSNVTEKDLHECSDMFLTSTAGDIIRVTKFEGRELTESKIQKKLRELLWKY